MVQKKEKNVVSKSQLRCLVRAVQESALKYIYMEGKTEGKLMHQRLSGS